MYTVHHWLQGNSCSQFSWGGGGRDNMKYRSTGIKSTTIVCMCLTWGEVGELIVYLIYPQHNDSFLASFLH